MFSSKLHPGLLLALTASLAFACSKSKPKPLAHCVGISLSAAEAVTGVAETMTYCTKTLADCEALTTKLLAGTAGKCVATTKLWCEGKERCAPTLKRCELNQVNETRLAESSGGERTPGSCERVKALPVLSISPLPQLPAAPVTEP